MAIILEKKINSKFHQSFFRMKLIKNHETIRNVMTKCLAVSLKYAMKSNAVIAFGKIKFISAKKRNIVFLVRIFRHMEVRKKQEALKILIQGRTQINDQLGINADRKVSSYSRKPNRSFGQKS